VNPVNIIFSICDIYDSVIYGWALSKTQTGEKVWNPYYVFGGIVALVLIAFLFAGRH